MFQSFSGMFLATSEYTHKFIICFVVATQGRLKCVLNAKKNLIL